jgi:hypothetical protein
LNFSPASSLHHLPPPSELVFWGFIVAKMMEYRTKGFNGYGVKYSSFFDNRIAAATSANYGLVGNGRLFILRLTPGGIVAEKM